MIINDQSHDDDHHRDDDHHDDTSPRETVATGQEPSLGDGSDLRPLVMDLSCRRHRHHRHRRHHRHHHQQQQHITRYVAALFKSSSLPSIVFLSK